MNTTVIAEWARRHGRAFTLDLSGRAGALVHAWQRRRVDLPRRCGVLPHPVRPKHRHRAPRAGSAVLSSTDRVDGRLFHGARPPRLRACFAAVSLLIGAFALVAVTAPGAHADPFCDLFVSDHSINIDFQQPVQNIREQALQLTSVVLAIPKQLAPQTPKAVRAFFTDLVHLVALATRVTNAKAAHLLALRFAALSRTPSGRAAATWLDKLCPTTRDTDTTSPTGTVPRAAAAAPQKVPAAGIGSARPPVGPCALVTQAEATAALGADPGPGRSDSRVCIYGPAFADTSLPTLWVGLSPGGKAAFNAGMQASSDPKPEIGEHYRVVSGLGDAAYEFGKTTSPADIDTLTFLRGETVVVLTIFSPVGTAEASVRTPAAKAASRV